MKKFLSLTVLLLSLIVISSNHADAAVANWQKGISVQPTYAQDFGSDSFKASMDKAIIAGVNTVTLIIPVHQDNAYSNSVYAGNDTPTDQSLTAAAQYLRSKGVAVSFAIHDNPYDNQWRALIDASNRPAWFNSYAALSVHYAQLAQANGVSQIVMATELSTMTNPSINSYNSTGWKQVISAIRANYSGSLTYSAQRSGYKSDAQQLDFWPLLDKIGLSAYYALGNNNYPSQAELASQWDNWNNSEIKVLSQKYNKQILFTEVGYVSKDGSLIDPGTGYERSGATNQTVQASAYQSLFSYWNNFDYMTGVNLWDWSTNPNAGGANDQGYTPQNKQAEAVVTDWFNRSGTPTTPTQPAGPSTYTTTAKTTGTVTKNVATTVTASFASTQANSNLIFDVEIYNANGQKVKQQYYEGQSINSTSKDVTFSWTPDGTGTYSIKAGVFTAGWSSNLNWNDNAGTATVTDASTPVTPPVTTPPVTTPPVTTPPVTTPPVVTPPVVTPPTSANLSIWWPGSTQAVGGVQPFKAVVDGYYLNDYKMYWQVDGGTLNELGNVNDSAPHKESPVDLSGWHWNSNKKYTITFVAKNNAGTELVRKSVVITLY